MDTKALDHFFDNGNWQSGGEGDWEYEGGIDPQQACAELKILHEELGLLHDTALRQEQDKRQLRAELDADKIAFDEGKDVIRKYHEKLDQLCAELDEARDIIAYSDKCNKTPKAHRGDNGTIRAWSLESEHQFAINAFLQAHPERK